MKFAIVGAGLIGRKRALAAAAAGHEIVLVADLDATRAAQLAATVQARSSADWREVLDGAAVDAVVVATPHASLSPVAVAALDAGRHVLVEKPGGRNLAEVEAIAAAAQRSGRIAKVGYNHRFHPAILKARALVDQGELGPLMFMRGRYGHGGRPGYDKEWRFDKAASGGGQLIDQGSHLVDFAHWFLGPIRDVQAMLRTYFWDADVEDNCFLTLSTAAGQVAWLHATWTEWKNMFCLEIYGRDGKLQVDGLGGSYGVESLTFYKMLPGMGPPETTRWEWPFPDKSWDVEVGEFVHAIDEGRRPLGDIADALETMSVIDEVYRGAGA